MSIDIRFYLATPASRHILRDTLVGAGIGLVALEDFEYISSAASDATLVTLIEEDDPAINASLRYRPDNGVFSNRKVCFTERNQDPHDQFHAQAIRGVMVLLKFFPDADAYLQLYDAAIPALLYKDGRLVLAEQLTRDGRLWDAEHEACRALIDLPYTIASLGPWPDVPVDQSRA